MDLKGTESSQTLSSAQPFSWPPKGTRAQNERQKVGAAAGNLIISFP